MRLVAIETKALGTRPAKITAKCGGLIHFSKEACSRLSLKHQDQVLFFRDEEAPNAIYIAKAELGFGSPIRVYPGRTANCNQKTVADILLNLAGDSHTASYPVSSAMSIDGRTLVRILTESPISKNNKPYGNRP